MGLSMGPWYRFCRFFFMKLSVFQKSIAYQELFCVETYLVSSSNHEGDGNEEINKQQVK